MDGTEPKGRGRLWSGVIAVFIAGLIVGGLSATVLIRSHIVHVMRSGPARPQERVAKQLTGDLDLTAEQRAQVDRIVNEFGPRFEEFERQSRDEIRNLAKEMEAEIRAVLTPAQQATYDEHIKRMHEEFMKRGQRDHHGHHDRPKE
jgi:hypothetical protein